MTDREFLAMAYGALKAGRFSNDDAKNILKAIEDHLFNPKVINELKDKNWAKMPPAKIEPTNDDD